MSADFPRRPPQKSHFLLVAACVVVLLAGVGMVLDRRGPCRGWFGRARGWVARLVSQRGSHGPPAELSSSPASVEPSDTADPSTAPAVAESPPAGEDLQTRYGKLYREYLARAPRPKAGDTCRFALRSGERVEGHLVGVEPGRITVRVQHGTMSYPMGVIRRKDVLRLFPETAARVQALATLRRETEQEESAVETPPAAEPAVTVPPAELVVAEAESEAVPEEPAATGGSWSYDPTPGPTPDRLKPALEAFGDWLRTQHRRVGGRIAEKIYARQQAGRAVLYLRMDPMFMVQDYSTRHRIAEGMQIFWALRCQGDGVAGMGAAHVVLLDQNNRIVGGSRPDSPTDIWLDDN